MNRSQVPEEGAVAPNPSSARPTRNTQGRGVQLSKRKAGLLSRIDEFVDWHCSEPRLAFNRIVVLRYRSHVESRQLSPGPINLRLGVVRLARQRGV